MIRHDSLVPVRPSALDLARHCRYSATLAERFRATNEDSADGTAKHAAMEAAFKAGAPPEDGFLAIGYRLIREQWPGARWEAEVPCELADPMTGVRLTPEGTGKADLVGTLPDGTLLVGDLKFGSNDVGPPGERLQNLAYAAALVLERGAPGFVSFIWQPLVEMRLEISERFPAEEALRIVDEVYAIASADPDVPHVGPWCASSCYRRQHCKAFLLPVHDGPSALEPFTVAGGLTAENAGRALEVVEAMETATKLARDALKDFARKNGGISVGDGKTWGPLQKPGRMSLDRAALEKDHPELVERYTRQGAPYEEFRMRGNGEKRKSKKEAA